MKCAKRRVEKKEPAAAPLYKCPVCGFWKRLYTRKYVDTGRGVSSGHPTCWGCLKWLGLL